MAAERLPAGARVLVVGPRSRRLAAVLKEQDLDATAAEAMPEFAVSPDVGNTGIAASWDMAILVLGLSGQSGPERCAVLETARREAPLALLVDWQRAERNLEMPAEWLRRFIFRLAASAAVRRSRAAYDAAGGLEGVLYALRGQGRVEARASCLGGCVGLALFVWDGGR